MTTSSTMEKWVAELPRSRMVYPKAPHDRVKYWLWRFYTPLHTYVRDTSTFLGLVRHVGRQDYLLGRLHPERSVYDFVSFLVKQGFGNHFVAWKDDGELVSLRKTAGFKFQYHIRVFVDGEVRVHYEYTPEYRPLQHLIGIGCEDRTPEFKDLVQDWIVPATAS